MEEIIIDIKELEEITVEDEREVVIEEVPVYPEVKDLEVTPSKDTQVFKEDGMNYGEVKVLGDEDLVASNIKKDVEIFGVTGNVEEMTEEVKQGINEQEEIITNQETTLEEINQVIQDKILVKEKFKPRYLSVGNLFSNYNGTELDNEVSMLDTTYLTNLYQMFYNCDNLTHLDLSHWNTSNVTNAGWIFFGCGDLTNLNLNNWNTSNVTNMSYMFRGCEKITNLDLSSFDTSKVTNMSQMFRYCYVLKHLDIRNFTFDKVTNYTDMFSNFPTDCLIIVKSETEKEWILSKFSSLTNVKTVAELEG